jgi:hypothetical protein
MPYPAAGVVFLAKIESSRDCPFLVRDHSLIQRDGMHDWPILVDVGKQHSNATHSVNLRSTDQLDAAERHERELYVASYAAVLRGESTLCQAWSCSQYEPCLLLGVAELFTAGCRSWHAVANVTIMCQQLKTQKQK